MAVILDRCHECGTRLAETDEVCPRCGQERPKASEAAIEAANPQPAGGMAWNYRIPILNNRYTWVRWGWAAAWFGFGFSAPLTVLLLVMFGDVRAGGVVRATEILLALAAVPALIILGMGLFGALVAGKGLGSRVTLTPDRCTVDNKSEDVASAVGNVAFLFGSASRNARSTGSTVSMLLPGEGDARWEKVRHVEIDPSRRVISLHRRWHHPLRLYVPQERFEDAAAYVQAHVGAGAADRRYRPPGPDRTVAQPG